jgi:hypothetical protein
VDSQQAAASTRAHFGPRVETRVRAVYADVARARKVKGEIGSTVTNFSGWLPAQSCEALAFPVLNPRRVNRLVADDATYRRPCPNDAS